MSEENRTPTRQFGDVGDSHHWGESASKGKDNLQSQSLDRRMFSSEVDRRIKAIVAPLAAQLETIIQLVRELCERSSNRSTEGNAASERSRSSCQRSDNNRSEVGEKLLMQFLDFTALSFFELFLAQRYADIVPPQWRHVVWNYRLRLIDINSMCILAFIDSFELIRNEISWK